MAEVNGWYAPGLTPPLPLRRTGRRVSQRGRCPLGYLGAQIISGAGGRGALLCGEAPGSDGYGGPPRNPHTAVWLTEQALPGGYLKPFEIALTTARKTIRYIADEAGTLPGPGPCGR